MIHIKHVQDAVNPENLWRQAPCKLNSAILLRNNRPEDGNYRQYDEEYYGQLYRAEETPDNIWIVLRFRFCHKGLVLLLPQSKYEGLFTPLPELPGFSIMDQGKVQRHKGSPGN